MLLFPCLNPWGLVNNRRTDADDQDLNRLFHRSDLPLITGIKSLIKGRRFDLALHLHEDYDAEGNYIYELHQENASWGPELLAHAAAVIAPDARRRIDRRKFAAGTYFRHGKLPPAHPPRGHPSVPPPLPARLYHRDAERVRVGAASARASAVDRGMYKTLAPASQCGDCLNHGDATALQFPGPLPGRTQFGTGRIGEVFLAFDERLRRQVALKRLADPEGKTIEGSPHERAWREAIHLAAVQHPNVVTVHDFGSDAFGPFVIMELVHGETLDAVVARGAFPLDDFRLLARQTLEGLAAAHGAGLLHRDLKPSNIMLKYGAAHELQVKILDFGIARYSAELDVPAPAVMRSAPVRTVLGTVEFMAPEQFEHQPLTQRGELYSLGCIFYYALTGHDPFRGGTTEEIIVSHLHGQPADLAEIRPDLPGDVCAWVMRLLSRAPGDRPESVQAALVSFPKERTSS